MVGRIVGYTCSYLDSVCVSHPGGDEDKKQEGKSGSDGESEPRQLRMSTRLRSRRREEVCVWGRGGGCLSDG